MIIAIDTRVDYVSEVIITKAMSQYMNDNDLYKLAEEYIAKMSGGDVLRAIRIHANIATINTNYIVFQGSERQVIFNVFKAANAQGKLDWLLKVYQQEGAGLSPSGNNNYPSYSISSTASYIPLSNSLVEREFELVNGIIINPTSDPKRVLLNLTLSCSKNETLTRLDIPSQARTKIPNLRVPKLTEDEVVAFSHSIWPCTLTLKLYLADSDSLIDVIQSDVLISQPDFILIARELTDGKIIDHSKSISWIVNSGAKGINELLNKHLSQSDRDYFGYFGESPDEEAVNSRRQARAIFNCLKMVDINYMPTEVLIVNDHERMLIQRIQEPHLILTSKVPYANCLDGAILFASILERMNLDPVIALTAEHAVVGWKKNQQKLDCQKVDDLLANCEFIDITLLKDGFEVANSAAEAHLIRKKDLFNPNETRLENYARIIDIKASRKLS